MNVELGDRVEFERQNEKLMIHLQKLIYTSTHEARAEHIVKKKKSCGQFYLLIMLRNY